MELWLRKATTMVDMSGQERLTLDGWRRLGLDWFCWQDGLVMVAHGDDAMTIRGGDADAGTVRYGTVWCSTVWHGQVQRQGTMAGAYTPSVLVTMGRLFLLSLGEDILEVWGEVRAV
jgi:hypothetical protein